MVSGGGRRLFWLRNWSQPQGPWDCLETQCEKNTILKSISTQYPDRWIESPNISTIIISFFDQLCAGRNPGSKQCWADHERGKFDNPTSFQRLCRWSLDDYYVKKTPWFQELLWWRGWWGMMMVQNILEIWG